MLVGMKTLALLPLLMLGPCPYDSPEGLAALNDVAHSDAGNPLAAAIFDYALGNWGTDERPLPEDLGVFCAISRGFPDPEEASNVRKECPDCGVPALGTPVRLVHLLLGAPGINQASFDQEGGSENYTFYRLDEKGTRLAAGSLSLEYTRTATRSERCEGSWSLFNQRQAEYERTKNPNILAETVFAIPGIGAQPNRQLSQAEVSALCNPPYYVSKIKSRAPLQFFDCWIAPRAGGKTPWDYFPPNGLESLPPEK